MFNEKKSAMGKNVVVKIFAPMVVAFVLLGTSCSFDEVFGLEEDSYDDYEETRGTVADKYQATHPLIEGHYVDFVNNQYVITISKEDALKKGISEACFDDFSRTIEKGNRLLSAVIDSCIREGCEVNVSANIYNNRRKTRSFPRKKRFGETSVFPSGTITTYGTEYGKQDISLIPSDMASVNFDCYTYDEDSHVQIVIAESSGVSDIRSGVGSYVSLNARFFAANVSGSVQYATTCDTGGMCLWQGCAQ